MYPLMPLFLTGALAAPALALGVIEGCAEVAAGLSRYFAGKASDSRGRKTFISSGYGLAGIGKLVVASSIVWPTVLIGRVIDRIGKGIRSAPRDAMITNSVEPQHYARALGFHRAADTLGAVFGPLIALVGLALSNGNVRAVMWWAVVPAMLSVLLTFLIRETKVTKAREPEFSHQLPLPPKFWKTSIPLIAIALTNIPDTLLLLRISQLGATTTQVVLAYIGFNLVYTVCAYPAAVMTSSLTPRRVYALGLIAFALTFVTLGLMSSINVWLFVAVACYGLFPALTDGIGKSMVASSVPKHIHGKAQGMYQSLAGVAILIAGTWAGLTWNVGSGNGSVPMTIAGLLSLLAAMWLFMSKPKSITAEFI